MKEEGYDVFIIYFDEYCFGYLIYIMDYKLINVIEELL